MKAEHVSPGYDNFPAWSPRGDLISFTSFRNGDFDIYIGLVLGITCQGSAATLPPQALFSWSAFQ